MKKQQGAVKRLRMLGNKGSKMSGDDARFSKIHKKLKKARRPTQ